MKQASKKTLLVGTGNPLSGDDGFGAQVLDLLHRNGTEFPPGVFMADAHTDLLNHIENFAEHDRVVLIDAILDPEGKLGAPGSVLVFKEEDFQSWSEASQSVHQISPLLAIRLFRRLYPGAETQIILIGLLADRITHAPLYSTEKRVREAAALIESLVNQ